MGGEDKLAKRRARGQLNAEERLTGFGRSRLVHRDRSVGCIRSVQGGRGRRRHATARSWASPEIEGRDVGVVVNDFTVAGASTSATNSKKMGHVRRTATEKGMPFIHVGESTGARLPDAMGSRGMGLMLGNDPTQFRRSRETPVGGGGARYRVRVVGVALLLLRFRGDAQGLDHGSVEPASRVHGDRREGRSGGSRRLANSRRVHGADRPLRRYRRGGDAGDPDIPELHAVAQHGVAAVRVLPRRMPHRIRPRSSTCCRRSAPRSTTCARSSGSSRTGTAFSSSSRASAALP